MPRDKSRSANSRAKNTGAKAAGRRRRGGGPLWLYGTHAVAAALANPARRIERVVRAGETDTRPGGGEIGRLAAARGLRLEMVEARALAGMLPPGAVHQGVAVAAWPLAAPVLADACRVAADPGPRALTVVLDQVTDPRNLGAILRSAAAFGARAVVVQDRSAPPETGVLAKAASGGLDRVPLVRVANLARALDDLSALGYWRIALDAGAATVLDAAAAGPVALVLGAEGKGLRRLTRERCDAAARLPMAGGGGSLNVSVAAAIALYEFIRGHAMDAPGPAWSGR